MCSGAIPGSVLRDISSGAWETIHSAQGIICGNRDLEQVYSHSYRQDKLLNPCTFFLPAGETLSDIMFYMFLSVILHSQIKKESHQTQKNERNSININRMKDVWGGEKSD